MFWWISQFSKDFHKIFMTWGYFYETCGNLWNCHLSSGTSLRHVTLWYWPSGIEWPSATGLLAWGPLVLGFWYKWPDPRGGLEMYAPILVQFLLFSCSFWQKSCQIKDFQPKLMNCHPPSGKSWICHCFLHKLPSVTT